MTTHQTIKNIVTMKKYELFIIGTGVAGGAIANKFAGSGLKIGIVDDKDFGGTCGLRGCIPKKVLVNATHVVTSAENLLEKGISNAPTIIWKDLIAFMDTFTEPIPLNKEKDLKEKGIDIYHGKAIFISKNQLKIGDEIIEAEKIVIATGATPLQLTIPGAELALNSDDFFLLKDLPKSILFVGGGYIALEFSHIAARCGSKVTIIDMSQAPLPNFDQDLVPYLVDATEALGIELIMSTKLVEIRKNGKSFTVIADQDGQQLELHADAIFNTAGRVPAIADLNLEQANINYTKKGVEVNEYLQSVSNKHIYAAGDNTDSEGLPLTPFASMEGHIVASNIMEGNHKKPDYSVRPTVIFTLPPLSMVGLTEKQAVEKKLNIRCNFESVPHWYSAKHRGEDTYAYKVIIDNDTDLILGAHIIGPNADESINIFALAIKTGMKSNDLKKMPFIFPSSSSDITKML